MTLGSLESAPDVGPEKQESPFTIPVNIFRENELDKIWISFYKIDKARTREDGGTGLGLSIVRAIQEAHGNAYGVNNIAGEVEFWFELDNTDHLETD